MGELYDSCLPGQTGKGYILLNIRMPVVVLNDLGVACGAAVSVLTVAKVVIAAAFVLVHVSVRVPWWNASLLMLIYLPIRLSAVFLSVSC